MTPRTRTLALLAVLAAAGAAWFYLRKGPAESTAARPRAAPAPAMPAARPAPAAPEPGGPPTAEIRLGHDDDPAGALRLEGQVIDAEAKPVGGARVALDAHPPREVTAEEDGSFAFTGLVGRDYRVEAHAGAAHAGPVAVRLTATTEPVILHLREAGNLDVLVLAADGGKPIAGATVTLRGALPLAATTDATGHAILAGIGEGWRALEAAAPGYSPARRMVDPAGVAGATAHQTLELERGATVSGRVLDPLGKPLAGARVLADDASDPFPVGDPDLDSVVTDARGAWRVAALPAGTFRFRASHPRFGPATSPPLVLDGETARKGVDIVLTAGARVAGRVVDAAGQPAGGAAVRIDVRGGGVAWHLTRQAFADDQGAFAIGGLPLRAVDLVALHESGSSALMAIDLGASPFQDGLVVTLENAGTIAGVVRTKAGEPVPEAQVLAELASGGAPEERNEWRLRGLPEDLSDAGGRFTLRGLPPGKYRLRAAAPGAAPGALWLHPGVLAAPGDQQVNVVVGADGQVTGKVRLADGSAPTSFLVQAGWSVAVPFSDASFTLATPAGKHNLFITGPSFSRKMVADVVVEEGRATDVGTITVEPGRSVSGRVVDGGGQPVAGAHVVCGRQISGSGSELNIREESDDGMQEGQTGADGRFLLAGLGAGPLALVAEQAERGRSQSMYLPPGARSVEVVLVLQSTGALVGTVTRAGAPLPSAVIIATPRGAPRSNFFTITGEDGSYALEKLTGDEYIFTVLRGGGGPRPKDLELRTVTVVAGEQTRFDCDVPKGPVALEMTPATDTGEPVAAAALTLVSGEVAATRITQVFDAVHSRGPGSMYSRNSVGGQPVTVPDLVPGRYTACVLAIPGDFSDMLMVQKLMEKADTLPVRCTPFDLRAAPALQKLTVTGPVAAKPE